VSSVEVETDPSGAHPARADGTMEHAGPPVHPSKRERVGLELVAAYSFVKAVALIAAGMGALGLLNGRVAIAANRWLEGLALRHESRLAGRMADYVLPYLDRVTGRHLIEIALGAFFFAAIYIIEGVGLWRCRRWAEYLTIGVSASFLPFELIAIFRHVTLPLLVTFILNVAVVAFLAWQVRVAEQPLTEGE
jgi:uncharacterized membrane protein (DUF2068 family)